MPAEVQLVAISHSPGGCSRVRFQIQTYYSSPSREVNYKKKRVFNNKVFWSMHSTLLSCNNKLSVFGWHWHLSTHPPVRPVTWSPLTPPPYTWSLCPDICSFRFVACRFFFFVICFAHESHVYPTAWHIARSSDPLATTDTGRSHRHRHRHIDRHKHSG